MFILIEKKSDKSQQSVAILGPYETQELAESRAADRKQTETNHAREYRIDDIRWEWFVAPLPVGELTEVIWPHQ